MQQLQRRVRTHARALQPSLPFERARCTARAPGESRLLQILRSDGRAHAYARDESVYPPTVEQSSQAG